MQQPDLLVARFHRYFRHEDPSHDVLVPGDRAPAVRNVREALFYLGRAHESWGRSGSDEFDDDLFHAIRAYQRDSHHAIADGKVGPNTRRRLITDLLAKHGPTVFGRLAKNESDRTPSVFLSYAWDDKHKVEKLDQLLRNRGIRVLRDVDFFIAGATIEENIRSAVARADKIVIIHSKSSKGRDYPGLEQSISQEIEKRLGERILIYVRLDDTPLPKYDSERLAINAQGRTFREIVDAIVHSLTGIAPAPKVITVDENERL